MKRYLLYVWVLMLLGVVSCTKEETLGGSEGQPNPKVTHSTLTPDEAERFVLLNDDYAVSKAEMLMRAKGLAGSFAQNETKTKGATTNRTPVLSDSIMPVAVHTRSGEAAQSPKIYVVSFGDKAGYALFAGDKRVSGDVLAFSDEGDFDQQALHSGMTYAIECMQAYMLSEIDRLEAMRGDSIYNALAHRYGTFGKRSETATKYPVWNGIEYVDMPVDNISEEFYEYKSETTSAIKMLQTQWYQYYPYNISINNFFNNGVNYPAGCVTTAVAQIMNYHQFGTYKGHQYLWGKYAAKDWSNTPQEIINNVGDLFIHLANTDNLHSNFSENATGANNSKVPLTFRNFGYLSSEVQYYNLAQAKNDIKNGLPVYASGFDRHNDGHAWVLDGYQMQTVWEVWRVNYWYQGHLQGYELVKRYSRDQESYIHVNYGWAGRGDFWSLGLSFPYTDAQTGELLNFDAALIMITGIKPNK